MPAGSTGEAVRRAAKSLSGVIQGERGRARSDVFSPEDDTAPFLDMSYKLFFANKLRGFVS